MKSRQHQALSRKVVRLLNAWKDPHSDQAYTNTQAMRSIDIDEQGRLTMIIEPARPHCPCCLLDLRALHKKSSAIKGVTEVNITVEGVPAAERWTREVNG
ncbi:MAG: iron-sulfur cluster assembly protein [Euryarchaeota archaeon]